MKRTIFACALACATACDVADGDTLELSDGDFQKGGVSGKADSSVEAIILNFEFDGELLASSQFGAAQTIESQLFYTIGHLNGDNSVGRLDQLELSNIKSVREGNMFRITYHATIPVAWGKRNAVPATYEFRLPRDNSFAGLERFNTSYNTKCVDFGAHDVSSGNMWYYYRPARSGCSLAETDIVRTTATVTVSDINTTGKYPEYHKVWEDDALHVLAVFGKYEDGATTSSDAGISAYNKFNRAVKAQLGSGTVSTPASVPNSPGVAMPDVTWEKTLADGKKVKVTSLLVDNVREGGDAFEARYAELSGPADFIVYNGHAGLGANIRKLAGMGDWQPGQYTIVFMNGCDTYAYVDSALADARAAINDDDPTGTKHLDIMTNGMPSFFADMSDATMAIFRGLLSYDDPQTYEQIMANIASEEVVLVSGEQDNVFVPGARDGDGGEAGWEGLEASGTVKRNEERRFQTPKLAAGQYFFEMSGTGDADLYVRTGAAPTEASFECRPFKTGSNEGCMLTLNTAAEVHVMVRGWASSSTFELIAGAQ
jgi:hypothetical protein